jgi:hypothetical protein
VELESNITIDGGVNQFGIQREIILEGDQVVTKLTYDAEPMLRAAHHARVASEGQRWGDGQLVGIIPIAELTRINDTYKSATERKHQILSWLRDNPKLVTFDRFLK